MASGSSDLIPIITTQQPQPPLQQTKSMTLSRSHVQPYLNCIRPQLRQASGFEIGLATVKGSSKRSRCDRKRSPRELGTPKSRLLATNVPLVCWGALFGVLAALDASGQTSHTAALAVLETQCNRSSPRDQIVERIHHVSSETRHACARLAKSVNS